MRAYERLLRYVKFDTASDASSQSCPSTKKQLALARALAEELSGLGLADAHVDKFGYVYATLPANCEGQPTIGLIAHMDTVDVVPTTGVCPVLLPYEGGPIALQNGDVLAPEQYPGIEARRGKTLIVTNGNTLLGADDKAGIAEIVTALETLAHDPAIPHGTVKVAFTPDEEIGRGADRFDVQGFGADFAYTVDGGDVGGIEYENFNAASAVYTIHGVSVHPGSAKGRMVNANRLACELNALFPGEEVPERTEGYEGFYHLCDLRGSVEECLLHYIIRDHDRARFEARKRYAADVAEAMNARYGAGTVEVKLVDSYYNMREVMEKHMDVIHRAEEACRAVGIRPHSAPIRGGTDGCRLSFMGLPCPDLGTGGFNYHSRHELIAIEDMDAVTAMLVELVRAR